MLKPTALIVGVIMVVLLSASYVSAQDSSNYPPIVQKLAEKFNLNEKDVQAVFDEERDEHFADMQARWSEKLDDLVNDGKITKEQKDSIINKHEEMHNKMLELKDLQPEERRTKMQELKDDLKKWAEGQGIDLPVQKSFGVAHHHGYHHGYMMGN